MATPSNDSAEEREMYREIATLIASLGKAFALPEADVIAALERGGISLSFGEDANGNRFVLANHHGVSARIYQGAIKQEGPES